MPARPKTVSAYSISTIDNEQYLDTVNSWAWRHAVLISRRHAASAGAAVEPGRPPLPRTARAGGGGRPPHEPQHRIIALLCSAVACRAAPGQAARAAAAFWRCCGAWNGGRSAPSTLREAARETESDGRSCRPPLSLHGRRQWRQPQLPRCPRGATRISSSRRRSRGATRLSRARTTTLEPYHAALVAWCFGQRRCKYRGCGASAPAGCSSSMSSAAAAGSALDVLVSFGRIGLFALGGGNAMTKLIEAEVVNGRGWLTIEEFGSLFGLAFLFPGLTQVKLAAMIGQKVAGLPGCLAAVLGLNLPGLALSVVCWSWLSTNHDSPAARKLMFGMRYGAVAMLAAALAALARPLAAEPSLTASLLALGLFIAVEVLHLSTFGSVCAFASGCLLLL